MFSSGTDDDQHHVGEVDDDLDNHDDDLDDHDDDLDDNDHDHPDRDDLDHPDLDRDPNGDDHSLLGQDNFDQDFDDNKSADERLAQYQNVLLRKGGDAAENDQDLGFPDLTL